MIYGALDVILHDEGAVPQYPKTIAAYPISFKYFYLPELLMSSLTEEKKY